MSGPFAHDHYSFVPGLPNITQPTSLNSNAEFDAAPMRLRGGSDASSGGSIFLALPVLAP